MTKLTDAQLAHATELMRNLPNDAAARFDLRIRAMMKATARDRTWATQRCAEQWPVEFQAYLAAKAQEAA